MMTDEIYWKPEARDYANTYGLAIEDVEAIVRKKPHPKVDDRSAEVGHRIMRYRAGDVIVVVGLREPDKPMVMSVWVDHHSKAHSGSKNPSGSGKSGPTTIKELTKRIIASGYRIEMGGAHSRVLDKETGEFLMALPITPSDHRTVPNVWATFLRKKALAEHKKGRT